MNSKQVLGAVGALALGLLVGGLVGHFATPTGPADHQQAVLDKYTSLTFDQWQQGIEDGTNQWILDNISTDNIEKYLRVLSAEPHLAATPRDDFLAQYIKDHFLEVGFDWAEMLPYNVYLSRPNASDPNKVRIWDGAGGKHFESRHREDFDDANVSDFVDAFNAYTIAGTVTSLPGEGVVYVNYGRVEDFQQLTVNVTGRIALMRYGAIYRGNKIQNAEQNGAIGAILFSDPEDVANEGQGPEDVYPATWWLPETGMQRGSAFLGDGDPLTPGWPSTEHAYRRDPSKAELMGIPAQPIGYADALTILKMLGGPEAPDSWQGGLNLTYNLGPELLPEYDNYTLELSTHNTEFSARSYNVFGTIEGAVEPDRYVLIGNHRDAWGYGASDPSSGTAQLLETARVLGELLKEGWRPRRTLVFCSWGAEEYGLIGSTEWVEEHVDRLQGRAVAYVNTDTCATGPVLEVPASPLLWDMVQDITKMVPGVSDSTRTVYDEWLAFHKEWNGAHVTEPVMTTLGSGSDYAHFFIYAGVPAMDIWFRRDKRMHDISIYPSYHTGFETFEMVAQHNDKGFKSTQGCGRLAALTLKQLSDSLVLPFGLTRFPRAMKDALDNFRTGGNDSVYDTIVEFYEDYKYLEEAVTNLEATTERFHSDIAGQTFDPVQLRRVNDQLMKFEQTFIIPEGLPYRPYTRHSVFAPSQFDNYASAGFPGIVDLIYRYRQLTDADELLEMKELIKQHVSLLTIITNRAQGILKDLHKFN